MIKVTGKIHKLVSDEDIQGKDNKVHVKRIFVLEMGDKYKDYGAFEVFGKANTRMPEIRIGDTVTITFSLTSREWNGKWFTSARVIYMDIDEMNPGGDYWPSGGRREDMFTTSGQVSEQHRDENYDENDLPF